MPDTFYHENSKKLISKHMLTNYDHWRHFEGMCAACDVSHKSCGRRGSEDLRFASNFKMTISSWASQSQLRDRVIQRALYMSKSSPESCHLSYSRHTKHYHIWWLAWYILCMWMVTDSSLNFRCIYNGYSALCTTWSLGYGWLASELPNGMAIRYSLVSHITSMATCLVGVTCNTHSLSLLTCKQCVCV